MSCQICHHVWMTKVSKPTFFHYDHTSLALQCPSPHFWWVRTDFLITSAIATFFILRELQVEVCSLYTFKVDFQKRARMIYEDDFCSGDHDKTPIHIIMMENLFIPLSTWYWSLRSNQVLWSLQSSFFRLFERILLLLLLVLSLSPTKGVEHVEEGDHHVDEDDQGKESIWKETMETQRYF